MIKNHPLADGNKHCGSFLFLWYLRRNAALLAKLPPPTTRWGFDY
ncbi:hypothetical protein ACM25P_04530 [Vreelandella alkaliphila]